MNDTDTGKEAESKSTRDNPHSKSVLKLADAMLRYALWPAATTVVLAAIVATALLGVPGLLSALIGGAVAFAASLATLWMMRKTSGMEPMAVMALSLGGYIVKLLILFGVMTALGTIEGLDRKALALSMLAVFLVWAGAEVLAFKRTKIATIIPDAERTE